MSKEDEVTLDDVIKACSHAKLEDGSLTFDSIGSDQPRQGTNEFLESQGWTYEDAEEIINTLKKEELKKGPVDHYNKERKHKLWIFEKEHLSLKLYIKLLIYKNKKCVAVISLHD